MLKPRFSVARPLVVAVWLGLMATVGIWGCQGPDTFIRKGTGGSGAAGKGAGGSSFGAGGSFFGAGGSFFGSGGSSFGVGGSSFGSGGSQGQGGSGTGGRIGTGGSSVGGSTGAGGARDGGSDGGTDAKGAGGAIVDANPDSEGGVIGGTGPCAGLCAPAISFTPSGSYHTGNIGLGEGCYETTGNIQGIVCSSFTQNGGNRMLSVNGVPDPTCDFNNATFPAPSRLNGGYCLQITPGMPDFAGLAVF